MPNVSTTPTAWELISDTFSGGASYVGVFPNTTDDSWVNSYMTSSRTSGMAHELGHNFGMSHQRYFNLLGVETAEYTGCYDALHGAIMGYDPGQLVHKWYLGLTAATTLEDDVAIVANDLKVYDHGDGMAPDDAGNTIGTATAMTANGSWCNPTTASSSRLTDQDAYSFTSTGGIYTVAATPTGVSQAALVLNIYGCRRQPPGCPPAMPWASIRNPSMSPWGAGALTMPSFPARAITTIWANTVSQPPIAVPPPGRERTTASLLQRV